MKYLTNKGIITLMQKLVKIQFCHKAVLLIDLEDYPQRFNAVVPNLRARTSARGRQMIAMK